MKTKESGANAFARVPKKSRYRLRLMVVVQCVSVLGLGAVPNSFAASPFDSIVKSVGKAIPYNPFDTDGTDFNKLVDAGDFAKADAFFQERYSTYFDKRFNENQTDVTPQLQKLAAWFFEKQMKTKSDALVERLKAINQLKANQDNIWVEAGRLANEAEGFALEIRQNKLLNTSKTATSYAGPLTEHLLRLQDIARSDRQSALESTFGGVLASGTVTSVYPFYEFKPADYQHSDALQQKIFDLASSSSSQEASDLLKRLSTVTDASTLQKLEKESQRRQAIAKLGRGPYELSKLPELRDFVKTYGADSGLQNDVKIGYIDLTATSFKDRNVFDFELEFTKDYGLTMLDAKEDVLGKASIAAYDFIFVTDLSAAKIYREFKNKKDVGSKVQSGTKEQPNPEYVTAMSNYQNAMSEMQAAKLRAASDKQPCYGSAIQCVLLAGIKGMGPASAERTFKEKSEALAKTSQTVTIPTYSKYSYQLVDINASKVARVDYYVIDVRKKQIFSNYFEVKDNERFTVSYNVEEGDPDASSILRNNQREEDVTAWEKRPIPVNLSALFDPANFLKAPPKSFVSVEAFLKPLTGRQYASANVNYVAGSTAAPARDSKGNASTISSNNTEIKSSASRIDSGVVADERFDSVVIVKTSKAIGTGFYVTPDLVLTAFHVVDGSNLVEMTFYDGTKTFGKVIDSDVRLDLALIKAQTTGKPVKIHAGQIKLGETAEAIGHPKGYEFTITRGVVSALRKQAGAVLKAGPPIEFIQTDTPISPGNSGGPLFLKDSVIGVNDWVRVDKASQNLNFSVSYNEIREYLNRFEGKSK